MNDRSRFLWNRLTLLCVSGLLGLPYSSRAQSPDDVSLAKVPTIAAPKIDELRVQVEGWLDGRGVDPLTRTAIESLWRNSAADDGAARLDLLAATFSFVDGQARALADQCSRPRAKGPLLAQDWLDSPLVEPFLRDHMRLLYGRWLSQQDLVDESLAVLDGLRPTDVADPAMLLFYQSVAYHRLLHTKDGIRATTALLEDVVDSPRRYASLASQMRDDLQALKDDSLDHISRRMDDIRRRLDLGHAGKKVRRVEDGVIASLDKLIEEMEEQQKKQQGGAAGGAAQPPSSPQQDSRIARMVGPGETDRRNVGKTAGWGDLPPKQREEALQQIGKDFPSYYRDAIEQFFRKLASEGSQR